VWAAVLVTAWATSGLVSETQWPGSSPASALGSLSPTGFRDIPGPQALLGLLRIQPLGLLRFVVPDLAAVLGFVLACACAGWPLGRYLGGARLERFIWAFTSGSMTVGWALLVVALAGVFWSPVVLGVLGGLALLGIVLRFWLFRTADEVPPRAPLGWGVLAVAGMVLLALLLLARSYVPDMDPDSVEFHRVAINQIVRTGRLALCLENFAANRPLQVGLFQALALDDRALSVQIQAVFTVMGALTVAGLLWRRTGPALALTAGLALLANHGVLWRAAVHADENALGFYTLAGFGALAAHAETGLRRWLVFGAAILGFSVGTYYLGFFTTAAGLAMVLAARRGRRSWAVYLLVVGVAASPWLVRNVAQLGNPVFPLLYEVFGGTGLNATSERIHSAIGRNLLFLPRNPLYLLTLLVGWPKRELFDPVLLVALPWGILNGGRWTRILAIGAGAWYLQWLGVLPQDRFLLPLLPAVAVLGGVGLGAVGEGRVGRILRVCVGVVLASTIAFRWIEVGGMTANPLAILSRDDPSQARPGMSGDALVIAVNQRLPADARIAGISNGFFARPSYTFLPVGFFDLSTMQDEASISRSMTAWRISWLIVPVQGTPAWDAWAQVDYADPVISGFLAALQDFRRRHCAQTERLEDYEICRLTGVG